MAGGPGRSERGHWAFAFGSDEAFRLWITHQPSCLSGDFGEWHDGEGRNVAAHVRSVKAGAGVARKPPFSAVPLTDAEHRATHQYGNSHFRPPEWWESQAEEHLRRWAATREG